MERAAGAGEQVLSWSAVLLFLSYRRGDSLGTTGRITDRLRAAFGDESIYRDIESVPAGEEFAKHLAQALKTCDLVLVIIGPKWLDARLQRIEDFVRIELELAFSRRIPVIPVLVEGASLPAEAELPSSVRALVGRQAVRVDAGADFDAHMQRLIDVVQRLAANAARGPKRWSSGGILRRGSRLFAGAAVAVLGSALIAVTAGVIRGWRASPSTDVRPLPSVVAAGLALSAAPSAAPLPPSPTRNCDERNWDKCLDDLESSAKAGVPADARTLSQLRVLADDPAHGERALKLAARAFGEAGADVLFEVWSTCRKARPQQARIARELLADAEKSTPSKALAAVWAFSNVMARPQCSTILEALPTVEADADARSLPDLHRLEQTRGCGFLGAGDCWPCLRKGDVLARAIASVTARAAPELVLLHVQSPNDRCEK